MSARPEQSKKMRVTGSRRGFTLIELLIVVVIIGILAAIGIPKFAATKEKAMMAQMKSDLRNLATAQEAYAAHQEATIADKVLAGMAELVHRHRTADR